MTAPTVAAHRPAELPPASAGPGPAPGPERRRRCVAVRELVVEHWSPAPPDGSGSSARSGSSPASSSACVGVRRDARGSHADISHARDDAAQLVRVQTIRTSLVEGRRQRDQRLPGRRARAGHGPRAATPTASPPRPRTLAEATERRTRPTRRPWPRSTACWPTTRA